MIKRNLDRGFSLIELLVSMAIFLIMAVGFIPLLTQSYSTIFTSGAKNKAILHAQKDLERKLTTGTTTSSITLDITFTNGVNVVTFPVEGEMVSVNKVYKDSSSVQFDAFIPKR